jgi:RND family efflux transporter MFP subunit
MGILRVLASCFALALVLGGCGREAPEQPPPATRPVKLFTVEGGKESAQRSFPGRIDAAQRAELAFRVSGRLEQIAVKEGDLVTAGQILARLDPTDFRIALEDRQASFDNAERNFSRGRELIGDGNISRLDFDRMEADFRSARAALAAAQQDLDYTVMSAPFQGRIARRLVENYEDVIAKQTILILQNIDQLDVIIDIPESLLRSFNVNMDDEKNPQDFGRRRGLSASARFEGRSDRRFPLRAKELATKADEQTQTFRATFTMDAPRDFAALPGMTTTVDLDLTGLIDQASVKWVPVRSVQADSGLEPRVWVLDDASMTVSSRPVTIGRMSNNLIEIHQGLEGGEEIVSVGAPYLSEGMRVTRMAMTEQAIPRADDPSIRPIDPAL